MTRFSQKELTLLKTFYYRQDTASKEGFKINKASLYREVFNVPNMSSASATTNANKILNRFKSLSEIEQKEYLTRWQFESKEEEQNKIAENIKIMKAYNEGKASELKAFSSARKDGIKQGMEEIKQQVQVLENSLEFKTQDGKFRFRQMLGTLLITTFQDEISNYAIDEGNVRKIGNPIIVSAAIKGLVDLAKINDSVEEDFLDKLKRIKKDPVLAGLLGIVENKTE